MQKQIVIALAATMLTGCGSAGAPGTDVMSLGPDTYTVTKSAWLSFGGTVAAKESAIKAANDYCRERSREFLILRDRPASGAGHESVSVDFRCLSPGDQELRRPSPRTEPSVVIEDRRR